MTHEMKFDLFFYMRFYVGMDYGMDVIRKWMSIGGQVEIFEQGWICTPQMPFF
jgi:hypothetical protein